MTRRTCFASAVAASVFMIASAAQAAVVFTDNFEAGGGTGDTGGNQPIADLGSYSFGGSASLVTDQGTSGIAPHAGGGLQFLVQDRALDGAPSSFVAAYKALSTSAAVAGDDVHAEFYAYIVDSNQNYLTMALKSPSTTGNPWDQFDTVGTAQAIGSVAGDPVWNYPGNPLNPTGLVHVPNSWQKWEVDYTVGDPTYTLTIDGNSASGLKADDNGGNGLAATVDGLWLHSGSGASVLYIDDLLIDVIPEPSTVVMLLVGATALGACRWRRRQ